MNANFGANIHIARAEELLAQSRPEPAMDELRRHLTLEPDDPIAHSMMAQAEALRDHPKEALEWANKAIHLGPDIGYCHYVRAWILNVADKESEAETAVLEALRLDPFHADFYCLLGQIRCARSNWAGAFEAAEAGLTMDAGHVGCTNVRAMALMRQGKRDNAEAAIQSALAQDPENAISHTNQGWICLNRGDRERAMEHFREALRLDPSIDAARQGVLETLRTKYFVYRMLFNYYEWMAQFDSNVRRGIMFGAWALTRILGSISKANPTWNPVVIPVLVLYGFFVFLSWTGRSTFDLLLRLNPLGRLALSRRQVVASNWVGLCLLSAFASVGFVFVVPTMVPIFAAGCFVMLAIPAAAIAVSKGDYQNHTIVCGAAYTAIAGLETIGAILRTEPNWLMVSFGVIFFSFVAYTWIVGIRGR